jgi:arylformamidase
LVPDHPAIIEAWARDAEAYRATAQARLDITYGAKPRNRLDLFGDASASRPLVLFIHGGYWRSFDKSYFSHLASGLNAHGLAVAMPSYSLCPAVTIPDIIDELRQCCLFLAREFGRRMLVCGHSAGGHLAACLAATNWPAFGQRSDLVLAGLSLSGLFDLRPLLATPMNVDLRLTPETALMASPLTWPMTRRIRFESWVGGEESAEFIRQSATLAAAWTGLGLQAPHVEVAGCNHFTVVNLLADPQSRLTLRAVELAVG